MLNIYLATVIFTQAYSLFLEAYKLLNKLFQVAYSFLFIIQLYLHYLNRKI